MKNHNWQKIVHWSFLALFVVYFVSGLGIIYYQTVGFFTFGLLSKPLAFKIHNSLPIPTLILLIAHIYLAAKKKPKD